MNDKPIPVTEQLPELKHVAKHYGGARYSDMVLAWNEDDQEWFVGFYLRGATYTDWRLSHDEIGVIGSVTHWLPLPPKPE